jgi:hypothetical protein
MKNQRIYTKESTLNEAHGSITIITIIVDERNPLFFNFREDSNNQFDFQDFIEDAIANDALNTTKSLNFG